MALSNSGGHSSSLKHVSSTCLSSSNHPRPKNGWSGKLDVNVLIYLFCLRLSQPGIQHMFLAAVPLACSLSTLGLAS